MTPPPLSPRASLAASGMWEGAPWGEGVLTKNWAGQGVGGSPYGGGYTHPEGPLPPDCPGSRKVGAQKSQCLRSATVSSLSQIWPVAIAISICV
jgi:hypothetical protein